jgi:hypothetical protein
MPDDLTPPHSECPKCGGDCAGAKPPEAEDTPFDAWSFESKTDSSPWRKHDYCWPTLKMAAEAMAAEAVDFVQYGFMAVRLCRTKKWDPRKGG